MPPDSRRRATPKARAVPRAAHGLSVRLSEPRYQIGLALITVAAAAIRFRALFNDLWLDEIWSLRLVGGITTLAGILTRLHTDNNHPINSLFLYVLGPHARAWTYRLLSWAAGTAAVWIAGAIARTQARRIHPSGSPDQARVTGLLTAALFAGSYLFIHYSSEARGYAPAVFFALLALLAFMTTDGAAEWRWTPLFWAAAILGMLSHLIALQVLAGCLCWSLVRVAIGGETRRQAVADALRWHAVPWTLVVAYYVLFVRHVTLGGGPHYPFVDVLSDLAAFTTGVPLEAGLAIAVPVLVAGAVMTLSRAWRYDVGLAAFYVAAILAAPLASLASTQFVLLFPRYFIISAALALLLAGDVLGTLWSERRVGRAICAGLLAAFVAGSALYTSQLLRDGRGHYGAAVRYVIDHSGPQTIFVSSGSEFRNRMIIEYYASTLPGGARIAYSAANDMPAGGPQWLFLDVSHDRRDGPTPANEVTFDGHRYQRERIFATGELSGWDWWVYSRET